MSDKCEMLLLAQAREWNGKSPAESGNSEEAICQLFWTNGYRKRGLPSCSYPADRHTSGHLEWPEERQVNTKCLFCFLTSTVQNSVVAMALHHIPKGRLPAAQGTQSPHTAISIREAFQRKGPHTYHLEEPTQFSKKNALGCSSKSACATRTERADNRIDSYGYTDNPMNKRIFKNSN